MVRTQVKCLAIDIQPLETADSECRQRVGRRRGLLDGKRSLAEEELNLCGAGAFYWTEMSEAAGNEGLPVDRARAGDPEAWNLLFQRYQLPLFAWLQELLHDEQTSLDIVQETFAQAVKHIGSLRESDKFGAWLFGIAHQKCAQHWRRRRPAVPLEEAEEHHTLADTEPSATQAVPPDQWLIRKEDEQRFYQAIETLSPAHRAVALLYLLEEFSLGEISRITGAPVGTVKSRLHYARRALQQALRKECPSHENRP